MEGTRPEAGTVCDKPPLSNVFIRVPSRNVGIVTARVAANGGLLLQTMIVDEFRYLRCKNKTKHTTQIFV